MWTQPWHVWLRASSPNWKSDPRASNQSTKSRSWSGLSEPLRKLGHARLVSFRAACDHALSRASHLTHAKLRRRYEMGADEAVPRDWS